MAGQGLSVICAWCNRVVNRAAAGAPVTHTICPSCVSWTMDHPSIEPIASALRIASDLYELRESPDSCGQKC